MRILLVDDDHASRVLFLLQMMAAPNPWIRDAELVDRATPLETLDNYYEFDAAIFDQHLGLVEHGEELTGLHICQRIHNYQYEQDEQGNRLRAQRPTALMLLTGDDYSQIPFNARDYVDQIAYKHGAGDRHVDDSFGCVRALLRGVDASGGRRQADHTKTTNTLGLGGLPPGASFNLQVTSAAAPEPAAEKHELDVELGQTDLTQRGR